MLWGHSPLCTAKFTNCAAKLLNISPQRLILVMLQLKVGNLALSWAKFTCSAVNSAVLQGI